MLWGLKSRTLFAILFALILIAPGIFPNGIACQQDTGTVVAGSGTCTGSYDTCKYSTASEVPCAPPSCCLTKTYECNCQNCEIIPAYTCTCTGTSDCQTCYETIGNSNCYAEACSADNCYFVSPCLAGNVVYNTCGTTIFHTPPPSCRAITGQNTVTSCGDFDNNQAGCQARSPECTWNTCKPLSQSCSANAECCSSFCDPGSSTCKAPVSCKASGEGCTADGQCCASLHCDTGNAKCASCRQNGDLCARDAACCNGYCDPSGGFCTNRPNPSGRVNGALCNANSECASGYCDPQNSVCTTAPVCKPAGQACTSGGECCSTAPYCDEKCKAAPSAPLAWAIGETQLFGWVAISFAIAALFIGLAYMAAKLFEVQVLDAWVKVELQELAASAIIAIFCISLIGSVNSAAQFLTGEKGATDVITMASGFLQNDVYADGRELYLKLAGVYFNIAKVASYSYTFGLSLGLVSASMSESPGAGLSPLLGQVGQAMDGVSNFMLLAASQSAFLKFFGSAAAVMLPVGIFLRSFSLTRKIGGVVLAAVIASAVIYPAGMLVSREIYKNYQQDLQASTGKIWVSDPGNPPSTGLVCNTAMQVFINSPLPFVGGELGWFLIVCLAVGWIPGMQFFCSAPFYKIIEIGFTIIKSVFPMIMYLASLHPYANNLGNFGGNVVPNYYDPLQQFALPAVVKYSVLSLAVFIIPVLVAVTLLRSLAVTFGGEPQLYGLSKLV